MHFFNNKFNNKHKLPTAEKRKWPSLNNSCGTINVKRMAGEWWCAGSLRRRRVLCMFPCSAADVCEICRTKRGTQGQMWETSSYCTPLSLYLALVLHWLFLREILAAGILYMQLLTKNKINIVRILWQTLKININKNLNYKKYMDTLKGVKCT